MIIDFSNIKEECLHEFKGGTKAFNMKAFSDGLNKIMKGKLVPSASIGMHTHETNSEIMYITKGQGTVLYGGERLRLEAGDVHYCSKGNSHSLINDSDCDLEFFAVVPEQ